MIDKLWDRLQISPPWWRRG